jgi:hypothetical protein
VEPHDSDCRERGRTVHTRELRILQGNSLELERVADAEVAHARDLPRAGDKDVTARIRHPDDTTTAGAAKLDQLAQGAEPDPKTRKGTRGTRHAREREWDGWLGV